MCFVLILHELEVCRVSELAGAKRPVPLYIMTSPLNDTVIRCTTPSFTHCITRS